MKAFTDPKDAVKNLPAHCGIVMLKMIASKMLHDSYNSIFLINSSQKHHILPLAYIKVGKQSDKITKKYNKKGVDSIHYPIFEVPVEEVGANFEFNEEEEQEQKQVWEEDIGCGQQCADLCGEIAGAFWM